MPGKNTLKEYIEEGYYHIYNRGVEQRIIFIDRQDYKIFLRFIKEYLLPLNHPDLLVLQKLNPRRHPINCSTDIDLLAYCLMPNHFHLFVKQHTKYGMPTFIKALITNYVMYFNHKYRRIGPLFQGPYKAVLIKDEPQFLHITRYIHTNPKDILARETPLQEYPYSSYQEYLGYKKSDWIKIDEMLAMFDSRDSYKSFCEGETLVTARSK